MKIRPLSDFTFAELRRELITIGESSYRAQQLFSWLYQKNSLCFDAMTDISKSSRRRFKQLYALKPIDIVESRESEDGSVKFLQELSDRKRIETVIMDHGHYSTVCISTQVGCAMGCAFCLTGIMGLKRNLKTFEIVDQVRNANMLLAQRGKPPVKNIVYMGMGEPFHNYDNTVRALNIFRSENGFGFGSRRITISTSGLIPQINKFATEEDEASLAVSLNGVTQEMRERLMPIAKRFPIERLIAACESFARQRNRKITYEYVLIEDVTDSEATARALAALLRGSKAKVNLIPLNESSELAFKRPSQNKVHAFQKVLLRQGILTTQRHSKARDISGACGQLAVAQQK